MMILFIHAWSSSINDLYCSSNKNHHKGKQFNCETLNRRLLKENLLYINTCKSPVDVDGQVVLMTCSIDLISFPEKGIHMLSAKRLRKVVGCGSNVGVSKLKTYLTIICNVVELSFNINNVDQLYMHVFFPLQEANMTRNSQKVNFKSLLGYLLLSDLKGNAKKLPVQEIACVHLTISE